MLRPMIGSRWAADRSCGAEHELPRSGEAGRRAGGSRRRRSARRSGARRPRRRRGGKQVDDDQGPGHARRAPSPRCRKAKRGFTTALERIDPKILADVVIKATSLQERANASLKERGSVYRIGEIGIGAAIPPSITFTIERVDDPTKAGLSDSQTLLAQVEAEGGAPETIVTLDGTAIDEATIEEVVAEA